jgi:signal transduction histidine kinase
MKYCFLSIILFLVLYSADTEAQQSNVDSLQNLLKTSLTDTQKAGVLNQLAQELLIAQPEKAQEYAQKALEFANFINDPKEIQKANYTLSLSEKLSQKQDYFYYLLAVGILLMFIFLSIFLTNRQAQSRSQKQISLLQVELAQAKSILKENEKVIEAKKYESSTYQELENKIREQDLSLQSAAESLLQRNKDLEEFSYIVSHDLRGPVANMLGLTALFRNPAMPAEQYKDLVPYLEESAKRLDTTIRDLNEVLSIRNNAMKTRESVNVIEALEFITKSLKTEISENQVKILTDFSQLNEIYTVKSYLESILYNLISNAIKFRSPNRAPQVRLQAIQGSDFDCLTVSDNGLGIDLRSGTYKIFGLYQRMHTHTEGKGFGLYLVQTQIEALNGKIEVESQIGQGTTFKVYFKK